ncbi:protein-disulfide reductase DsbD [Celerinatantimonas sp. YJH-8]|uniref:protein-disulfide reductase DsbD n=1 Tax=Celerinatantimonas sp. YJH-8 TaxID=3228714 RepID=UPI0038C1B486
MLMMTLLCSCVTQATVVEPNRPVTSVLPVSQVFQLDGVYHDAQLTLNWQIHPGFYLYRDQIKVRYHDHELPINFPTAQHHHDPIFGDVAIYTHGLLLHVGAEAHAGDLISIEYRGCAFSGFCYPPHTQTFQVNANLKQGGQFVQPSTSKTTASHYSGQWIANYLAQYWWSLALMIVLGMGLAFTPCVLPIYPLVIASIWAENKASHAHSFWGALLYVQGMALTYTVLALIAGLVGMAFQSLLQSPVVIGVMSLWVIAMAGAMFGWYSLSLPVGLQTQWAQLSQRLHYPRWLNLLLMGALSGMISSPCTSVPLSGILLFILQSGQWLNGVIALYLLAVGMGIPLLIAAVGGRALLPRAGHWMQPVQTALGLALLSLPILLMARIWPVSWVNALWLLLGSMVLGWLSYLVLSSLRKMRRLVAAVVSLGIFVLGMHLFAAQLPFSRSGPQPSAIDYRVSQSHELDTHLSQARLANAPVILDFYADWCVACRELDQHTWTDPALIQTLKSVTVIKVDVTEMSPEQQTLLARYRVIGLPTLIFISATGNLEPEKQVAGYISPLALSEQLTSNAASLNERSL